MTKIGLLSDTHSHLDDYIFKFFENCDEIWHAGDIGNVETADKLAAFKPLKAVFGNIDGNGLRTMYKEHLRFMCEGVDTWITHIGGYPGKYAPGILPVMKTNPPKLFVSGHSHILKVMFDKKYNCLHINPGAAGISGFHHFRTAVRFCIDADIIKDLEVWEIKR